MDINKQFVITVSREVGSGGRTIGRELAKRLGVPYCDKNLINTLVEKLGLSAGSIEMLKGLKKNWLTDALMRFSPDPHVGSAGMPRRDVAPGVTTDDVYHLESEILKELAANQSCVIAGRSGFFILKDHPNKLDVFIRSSMSSRIARIMEKQGKNREEAEEIVDRVDRLRENYIQRYTGTSRYDSRNYDLVLNVDGLSTEEAVDIILKYLHAEK